MIPADCVPTREQEVIEIIEGPHKRDLDPLTKRPRMTFFVYWISDGHFAGPRGQIFKSDLEAMKARIKARGVSVRVVDRR